METLSLLNQDCWYGIEDAAERKKVQDRLAQRRKRTLKRTRKPHVNNSRPSICRDLPSSSAITQIHGQASLSPSPISAKNVVTMVPTTKSDDSLAIEVPPSVFAALFNNGAMMGLTCGAVVPSKSTKPGPEIPDPLQPTALQLTTIHSPWIDRFPFPKMRDNLITLHAIVDEEEFLRDLFSIESFTIRVDRPGWDPSAWSMGRAFAKKWGYLFY